MRLSAAAFLAGLAALPAPAMAHWTGPADPAMHTWFDNLAAGKGRCCSFADGLALDDPDWGTESVAGADGQSQVVYWVMVDGQKIAVPPRPRHRPEQIRPCRGLALSGCRRPYPNPLLFTGRRRMTDRAKLAAAIAALEALDRIVKRGGSFFQDGRRVIAKALAECRG